MNEGVLVEMIKKHINDVTNATKPLIDGASKGSVIITEEDINLYNNLSSSSKDNQSPITFEPSVFTK